MDEDYQAATELALRELETRHRELDAKIAAHVLAQDLDELSIARLKKQKLKLKDQWTQLIKSLMPDEPA